MKHPDLTITWRGIELEWSVAANAYIADTLHGRWMAQRHANDDTQWMARFKSYATGWFSSPTVALDVARVDSIIACESTIAYLKALPQ